MKKNIIGITKWDYALAMVCLLLSSCAGKQQPAPVPPVAVETARVKFEVPDYYDEYPATVNALNQVNITPQVTGYISGVHFQDGQHVTKGQLLYTLDQQQYQANVLEATANYKVAESNLAEAQQDADRYLFLQQNDAVARQVLDHSLAGLQAAKMKLEAARAAIQNVQTGLKYSTIYAPLSGTIGISLVKPGAAVSPGITLLNTISAEDPIAVDFNVNEAEIERFNALAKLPPDSTDSTFTITLPDGKRFPLPGHIVLLDRAVDPLTATIKTRVQFSNAAGLLKPGMSCVMRVRGNSSNKQLLIPQKSITEQLGESFVFVVDHDTVSRKKIIPGIPAGPDIIVSTGLKEGEVIVTDGTANLKSGMKVAVTEKR